MPCPYELYPKAKETHCLNLPEISVSRPPFPGSIRTADGCFWGERNNNSYVSTHKTDKVCTADGKCYNYNDVFVDEVDPGHSNTCGQTCYVACSCNTSNGWYSSCQGSDCFSVTDTRYAGQPNAASASRSLSDIGSISASGANSGISASAAAKSGLKTASAAGNYTATAASAAAAATGATSGISTMASGATTCYKKKTCSEGGYESSEPDGKKCTQFDYNGYTCYKDCKDDYFDFSVYTSGSTNNGSVVGMTTTVTITGSGYNKTIKQTTKTAGDYFSFSGIPSGSYTVEGQTTMQVKNGNGPGLFCAHNVESTFEVTKKVTIGSGGSRSVTLAFTCNTSSGGGSIIGGCPYDNNCRDSAEPKPMIIRGQKCCCPQDYSTSETINRCDCCVSEIL